MRLGVRSVAGPDSPALGRVVVCRRSAASRSAWARRSERRASRSSVTREAAAALRCLRTDRRSRSGDTRTETCRRSSPRWYCLVAVAGGVLSDWGEAGDIRTSFVSVLITQVRWWSDPARQGQGSEREGLCLLAPKASGLAGGLDGCLLDGGDGLLELGKG